MQSEKWCPSHKFFYVLFSLIQSFLLGFSWSPDFIVSKNKSTSNKEATSISDKTMSYLYKNINLLWYNVIRWSSHICKKIGKVVTKLNGVKVNVTYFLNGPVFNLLFYCHIVLYWEKVTSHDKFNNKSKLYEKYQRFNAIDGSVDMLKNSRISKNIN